MSHIQTPYKATLMTPHPRPAQLYRLRWKNFQRHYNRTKATASSQASIRLLIYFYVCRCDQRIGIFATHSANPILFERARSCHRNYQDPHSIFPVILYMHKMLLDSIFPKCFLRGTFRKPIGSTDFKDVVVGCEIRENLRLLSLAWAC